MSLVALNGFKIKLLTFLFLGSFFAQGQTKKYVEELALYHLDSLTKIDPLFKFFKYSTNGYLEKSKADPGDTLAVILGAPQSRIKSPFKNLLIIEDTLYKSFSVPKRIRKNNGNTVLNIFRFNSIRGYYYVLFSIETGEGGQKVLIVMNKEGDLVRRRHSNFLY